MTVRIRLLQMILFIVLFLASGTTVFSAPSPTASPKSKASPTTSGKKAKPLPSKHKAWSEAVTLLEKAKKVLSSDNTQDTNNHKSKAMAHIQKAMQELRQGTQGSKH